MLYDRQGSKFTGERYIRGAVEATGGSGVMLYVQYAGAQCDEFTVKNKLISRRSMNPKGENSPKSSPGHAVKPAARQPVERGQIVSCGPDGIPSFSYTKTVVRKRDEQTV
jgi:hypothetical protein